MDTESSVTCLWLLTICFIIEVGYGRVILLVSFCVVSFAVGYPLSSLWNSVEADVTVNFITY